MTAEDQVRYLQDALAIARGAMSGTTTAETLRIRALTALTERLLDALVWLEDVASSMPEHLYGQAGIDGAVLHAREVIHAADGLTRSDEEQANLRRERDDELGLVSRNERNAGEIAREFAEEPIDAHRGDQP